VLFSTKRLFLRLLARDLVRHRHLERSVRQDVRIARAIGGAGLEARVRKLGALSVSRFDDRVRELRCVVAPAPHSESVLHLTLSAELAPPHSSLTFSLQGVDLDRMLVHAFARLQRELRRSLASATGVATQATALPMRRSS
jgi:hypothetical protein